MYFVANECDSRLDLNTIWEKPVAANCKLQVLGCHFGCLVREYHNVQSRLVFGVGTATESYIPLLIILHGQQSDRDVVNTEHTR